MAMAGTLLDKPLSTAPALALATRVKTFNDVLRQELITYKDEQGLTNGALAKELAVSETAVVKYLNGKPEGDVAKFEARADSLMRSALTRTNSRATLTPTNVTDEMEGHFKFTQKTNDLSLVKGPSGIGKSCGCELAIVKNPMWILITASELENTKNHVTAQLWRAVGPRNWSTKQGTFLATIYRLLSGSNRQIIVDDAHFLSDSGFNAVRAIHDVTKCPISLVAFNEEVEDRLHKDGQYFSRIGRVTPISLESTTQLAAHLIEQFVPESGTELMELSLQVIKQEGHGRSLSKQLLHAREIKESLENTRKRVDWPTAFLTAHECLLRNYQLTV